eukprot:107896-Rhodomonas_salina.1
MGLVEQAKKARQQEPASEPRFLSPRQTARQRESHTHTHTATEREVSVLASADKHAPRVQRGRVRDPPRHNSPPPPHSPPRLDRPAPLRLLRPPP